MTRSAFILRSLSFLISMCLLAHEHQVSISVRTPPAGNQPASRIRVDSELVLVPVVVTDKLNRLVLGLTKGDFRLFDANVEQQISHFALEDAPVSVVLVFDTSGSMGKKLQISRNAVRAFLKESNPADEFALIQFSDCVRLVNPFTPSTEEIENRLTFLESRGRTALVDAVFLALDQMKHARHQRRAIVIISDGGDNCSRFSRNELKSRVREADVQIYSIGIMESGSARYLTPEEAEGPYLLSDIARLSGGRMFEARTGVSLTESATKIGSALRNQYVLGYAPSHTTRDGRYHRILVEVPHQRLSKLRVTFRLSYLAPAE